MNFSIKLKGEDEYVFSDGHNVWSSINYQKSNSRSLMISFGNAKIEIQGEIFEITEEKITKMLTQYTHLSLFDKEKKLLSKATILPKKDAKGTVFEYNGKTYKFSAKNNFSTSYAWKDSNDQIVMSFKTIKGFPVMKEMSIETNLDFKTKETLLLALWGFYLMPKNRDKMIGIITIIGIIVGSIFVLFHILDIFGVFDLGSVLEYIYYYL